MKVAVTSIMKNEPPAFIERWVRSAADAHEMVLVDTGSTNNAVECARDLGVTVHEISIKPWRFDVARNTALALLSDDIDYVVKLDVDEVLLDGWWEALEDAPIASRYSYRYIWNFDAEGNPDIEFTADHTHYRHGWMWEHPVHESLRSTLGPQQTAFVPGMTIAHYADPTKSRAQYLPLLAQAVAEAPGNDRMAHYYARELFFRNDWVKAREEFTRHLALPSAVWPAERAESYRYLAKMDDYPERWILRAIAEDPNRRDAWVDLAEFWRDRGRPELAAGFARRALEITVRPGDYMGSAHAWDDFALRKIADS